MFHIKKGKHFIVFDEFPWMASERTELISLLKYFWDNKWKKNSGVTLVICGSIASFMHKHIIHSKALHNRKTFEIKLQPLLINEAKLFFKNYRSNFEISKFLMIFGGIPKYLEQIDPTNSLSINLDRLCFMKHGFFLNEFDTIFKEQFKVTRKYEKIVKYLAHRSCSKEELSQNLGISSGGGLTDYIKTLERADFIKTFTPKTLFGKGEKTKKIVLWDEWLRFYFIYIEPNLNIINLNTATGLFEKITENSLNTYFGLCFERFCMKNISLILEVQGLALSDVLGYGSYFRQRSRINPDNHGLQIDILIHRKGQILTLVECKFSSNPITTSVIKEVQQKLTLLKAPKNYSIERVLICNGEITPSLQKSEFFHKIFNLDAVFSSNS